MEPRVLVLPATAAICAAVLLAGCSAQGQGASPLPGLRTTSASAAQPAGAATGVRFTFRIPHASGTSLRGRYVSPSTKSVTIVVFNAKHKKRLATIDRNVTAGSQGCSSAPGGARTCTFTAIVPPGPDTFDVTTFDRRGGKGNKLSALMDFPFTVKSKAVTKIHMTLGGLAASIAITAPSAPEVTGSQGAGFTIFGRTPLNFTIAPMDRDGNVIIGPGAPTVALTGTPSNVTVAAPVPGSDTWTLTSTFTATDPGVGQTTTLAVQATPVPGSGGTTAGASAALSLNRSWIYVGASQNPGGLFAFDDAGNTVTPSPGFSSAGDTTSLAYDPANGFLFAGGYYNVQVYSRLGTVQSITFAGSSDPVGVAFVPEGGLLYVGNGGASGTMEVYTVQGVHQTVSGFAGMPANPDQVAFDPNDGNLYFANFAGGVNVYSTSGVRQSFAAANTCEPLGIAYDPHDDLIYVGNGCGSGTNTITAYSPAGVQANLTGTWAGINGPTALAFDPHTNLIYVANFNSGTITAYNENGDQQPLAGFSGMSAALGINAIAIVP